MLTTDKLQLSLDVLDDESDGHFVVSSTGNDNVGMCHQWRNVVLKARLHKRGILLEDAFEFASTLRNVAPQTTSQSNIRVRVHKHLHIQQLQQKNR